MVDNRRVSDEVVYRGRVVEVRKVRLRMPDGAVVDRDLVHHNGAAVILPVLADGRIVLIRNYRFAVDGFLYEVPAGTLENGEDPLDCARRELTEETGYRAGKLEKLGSFAASPGVSDEIMHAYLATELSDGTQELELHEEIHVEVIAPEQVRRMLADGTIRDGKTIAILGLYWLSRSEL